MLGSAEASAHGVPSPFRSKHQVKSCGGFKFDLSAEAAVGIVLFMGLNLSS